MPLFWDGSRAGQLSLNLIVIAVIVPIVEELCYRGLGFKLLSRFGPKIALWGTALMFGLAHGFVGALPIFVIVGLMLGRIRMRTGSIYPGMVMHGATAPSCLVPAAPSPDEFGEGASNAVHAASGRSDRRMRRFSRRASRRTRSSITLAEYFSLGCGSGLTGRTRYRRCILVSFRL